MNRFIISAIALISLSIPAMASAAGMHCSIHPAKNTPASTLSGLAKISQADAEKTAIASIKAQTEKTTEGELEVEHGCLVYSFDIRVSGKSGIQEVIVDAGTGKILSHKHETAKQEKAEHAKDKADSKKAQ